MKITTTDLKGDGTIAVTIQGDVHQIAQLANELNQAGSADAPRVANLGNDLTHITNDALKGK